MDVHRPELHASGFLALIEVAEVELGRRVLDDLLASLGTQYDEVKDPNGWFSLSFAERLMQDLITRSGDAAIVDRAMKLAVSPRHLGILYPLFSSFGTPALLYRQAAQLLPRLNKVTTWTVETLGPRSARVSVETRAGAARERSDVMCNGRRVILSEIATLFDLPPADVDHTQCMQRGDAACVYEVHWKEHRRRVWSWIGLVAGSVAGLSLITLADQSTPATWLGEALLGMGGWAVGRVYELRRDLRDRLGDLGSTLDALRNSSLAHERRYAELLDAKTELDSKVESRTSELREATEQLSQTLNKLQEIDRAKTDFFNNVSHELRSPLTMILAPLDELRAGRPPPGGERSAYDAMYRNASRLLRLINQLLDLAKIDAGEMQIDRTPTDLVGLARNCLGNFESAALTKGVRFEFKAPERLPPLLLDPAWVDSALSNLIANALRWTNSGGGVRLTLEDLPDVGAEGCVTLAVSDDGPGIAPADQAKVFERFAQGDNSRRLVGGTGIGLALVREAVRLHAGDVTLQSELGQGSTFTLRFPRRTATAAPSDSPRRLFSPTVGELLEDARDTSQTADRPGPISTAPLALVVEDRPELRTFIADVLASRYRVRGASDGRQGLELARTLRPDVIVSDVAMPELDGYGLCEQLRAHEETKDIPVLLVTARTDLNSVLRGFEAGANDYLLKPFHAPELLARVEVHVRLRRVTAQLARHERLAALGSLAASVAHNVRNPLSVLISGLPAVRNRLASSVDASTGELMTVMFDCAERIERMTLDLLDLSRIDREPEGNFAPGVGLLASTRMFGSRVGPDVQLLTEIDDRVVVAGRAGDLNHAFMNVLDNALRAVGPRGLIDVRARTDGDSFVVTVADSGSGIEPALRERVFEPFWTTRAAGEGTGLGLAIAREIVEEHGGTIDVDSSALGGALFTVRLPLPEPARGVA